MALADVAALPGCPGPARPPRRSSAKLGCAEDAAVGVSSSSRLSRSLTTLPFVGAWNEQQIKENPRYIKLQAKARAQLAMQL